MPRQPAPELNRVLVLGATSAIAQATTRLLAREGGSFFLVARDQGRLEAVAADLQTRGARAVTAWPLDLNDTARHREIVQAAVDTLGGLDLALVAYGVLGDQAEAQASFEAAAPVLSTNFLSPASLVTVLANYFESARGGCLAVLSSVAGDRGRKSNYVYGAAKAGLSLFLDGVRNRVDRAGVHVLTIKPGFVRTPMTSHLPPNPLFAESQAIGAGILRAIRSRRDVVYLPGYWRLIMLLIRSIPGRIFKGMDL